MASTTVIKMIGTLIFSFIIGLGLFYIIDANHKKHKRQQIEEVSSMIIQFIIYIWVGKIIVHLTTFLSDPVAVLAHPGDSKAFYAATILTLLHLAYKAKKRTIEMSSFIKAFVPILLYTSFMYEFLQTILGASTFNLYFIWVMLLAVGYIGLYNKKRESFLPYYFLAIWLCGALILSFAKGYLILFGFLLPSYYFIVTLSLFLLACWKVKKAAGKAKLND